MNNKIKDYIGELEEYDLIFKTIVFDNYLNKALSTKVISRFQKIYFECTGSREYVNLNCGNCVYRLIFNIGRMYIKYKESIKEEPKPYKPKLGKAYKPKTLNNGKGKK